MSAEAGELSLPSQWLQPLRLRAGNSLPNHILPAPMEGIASTAFCAAMAARGLVRCWITPFIRISTGVPRPARLSSRIAPFTGTGLPVVVQLMGTDVAKLAATAARLADLGVAGVDLNCACPSPTVVRNGAGGACLRDPSWIRDALLALRRACPDCGVSVKLRSGFHTPAEMDMVLPAVRQAAPDYAVLHFRTVSEGYQAVPAGRQRLAQARELLQDVTLLASGDLFSLEDAAASYRVGSVDGVTPARGLLRNPWLLQEIEGACNGCCPALRQASDRIELLRDIALAARAAGITRNGFATELAAHMFGSGHMLFRRLTACRTLSETCDCLVHAAEHAPGQQQHM